jgi:hypothetical protein
MRGTVDTAVLRIAKNIFVKTTTAACAASGGGVKVLAHFNKGTLCLKRAANL